MQDESDARLKLAAASERAVQSATLARQLGELNQDLIALLQAAIDGPAHPEKGLTAEAVLHQARSLAEKAEIVRNAPGSETVVPGTQITLAEQVIGNFDDVAILLEYDLPEIYTLEPKSPEFVVKQGELVISLVNMYRFVSNTLGELTDNLDARVKQDQAELSLASAEAARLTEAARVKLAEASHQARRNLIISFVLTVALLGLLFTIFRNSLIAPLKKTVHMISELEQGHLDVRLGLTGKDEINHMGQAMDAFADDLQNRVKGVNAVSLQLVEVSGNIATASKSVDASAKAQVEGVDKTAAAVEKISNSTKHIGEGVAVLAASVAESTASAVEMSASSEQLAATAEDLASNVEEVGASITEIATSIRQVADNTDTLKESSDATTSSASQMDALAKQMEENITSAAGITDVVLQDAEAGRATVEASITGISQILDASQVTSRAISVLSEKIINIGTILAMIEAVTEETSLLALNAAIIAAQAGQHGKGFSVVAEEIRELSDRTGNSTREIAEVINEVRQETEKVVQAIALTEKSISEGEELSRASGAALQKIVEGVQEVDRRMEQISSATREQTLGSRSILTEMEKVAEMVDQTVSATREQTRSAKNIMASVEHMNELTFQVKTSTSEQSGGSKSIARAMEEINRLLQEINQACENQSQESTEITHAIEQIHRYVDANLKATGSLQEAVSELDSQVQVLKTEMGTFRLAT
jgi:methyl-accepting chemotaxis protein